MSVRSKLLLLALLLAGCAPNVRFEGVESVRWHGTVGADVEVRVANDSRRTLAVEGARFAFFTASGLLGSVELRGTVEIPRRRGGVLASRWKFDAPDAAAGYVLQRRLENGELDSLYVEGVFAVRVGKIRRVIPVEKIAVSEFLSNFAVPCEE